jgi:hypothetical protein
MDLTLEPLHLQKGLSVVQTEHQDEHITCERNDETLYVSSPLHISSSQCKDPNACFFFLTKYPCAAEC